jgi:hypothetical protein
MALSKRTFHKMGIRIRIVMILNRACYDLSCAKIQLDLSDAAILIIYSR